MPYPWECIDCKWLDTSDKKYGEFYCRYNHYYVVPNSPSCRHLEKKSSSSNCYLTTAVVDILGYEDNCVTLDTLRNFRDSYMKNEPELLPLLEDYDKVGPIISKKINEDENSVRTAKVMLINYLTPACEKINENDYDSVIEIYKDMTVSLMDYYDVDKNMLSKETKGKTRQRK